MPTTLPVYYQLTMPAGTDFLQAADASGHLVPFDDMLQIWIENTSGSDRTASFTSVRDSDFGPYPTWDVVIPSGFVFVAPLFDGRRFRGQDGNLAFSVDSATSVRVGALVLYKRFKNDS